NEFIGLHLATIPNTNGKTYSELGDDQTALRLQITAAQASNPCPATASACVDLAAEQAWLQTDGKITYGPVSITSGAAGSRTRTGTFSVFWLDKNHKSSLFNNAPMPNSVFFDNDIAFHQGSLSAQSNGCIHLSWDASETFFDTLSVGDSVYVWGAPPY
ncbi:MAG: L,D-transpeptidase, partial [Nakamurella sp.]